MNTSQVGDFRITKGVEAHSLLGFASCCFFSNLANADWHLLSLDICFSSSSVVIRLEHGAFYGSS